MAASSMPMPMSMTSASAPLQTPWGTARRPGSNHHLPSACHAALLAIITCGQKKSGFGSIS